MIYLFPSSSSFGLIIFFRLGFPLLAIDNDISSVKDITVFILFLIALGALVNFLSKLLVSGSLRAFSQSSLVFILVFRG